MWVLTNLEEFSKDITSISVEAWILVLSWPILLVLLNEFHKIFEIK